MKIAALVMISGTFLMLLLSWIAPASGNSSPFWFGVYVILGICLGSLGIAAEGRLPIDLFPVIRRRETVRILYVLAACFFLAILAPLWSGMTTDILKQLAQGFGVAALNTEGAAAGFETRSPLVLMLKLMIGAGLPLPRIGCRDLRPWPGRLGAGIAAGRCIIPPACPNRFSTRLVNLLPSPDFSFQIRSSGRDDPRLDRAGNAIRE